MKFSKCTNCGRRIFFRDEKMPWAPNGYWLHTVTHDEQCSLYAKPEPKSK
jgi:hypothetical protein